MLTILFMEHLHQQCTDDEISLLEMREKAASLIAFNLMVRCESAHSSQGRCFLACTCVLYRFGASFAALRDTPAKRMFIRFQAVVRSKSLPENVKHSLVCSHAAGKELPARFLEGEESLWPTQMDAGILAHAEQNLETKIPGAQLKIGL